MKKSLIAIIAVVLAAILGICSYFIFFAGKDDVIVTVTVDDFYDSPDILENLMTQPEKYTKILETDYQLGTEKTAEFYECPEEWLTYSELISIKNTTDDTIAVYGLEIAENGKNGVYINTKLDGEFEIAPGDSTPAYFNILCDNGDLSTDEANALVKGMDIKIVYKDASVADDDNSSNHKTADINSATN